MPRKKGNAYLVDCKKFMHGFLSNLETFESTLDLEEVDREGNTVFAWREHRAVR